MKHNLLQQFLAYKALALRVSSILATTQAGSGHPTSCLCATDIVAVLFFYTMRFDPHNPSNPNNDRFILSKGHAAPLLYAVWKELGVLTEEELLTLRAIDSRLEGHPTPRFDRNEAATGSLGNGLGIGLGMALSAQLYKHTFKTYVLLGDSEVTEGAVWEAAELASFYKANNLIAIIDCNRLGQTGQTIDGWDTDRYARKFAAFGWHTITIDGHDLNQIMQALDEAQTIHDKPTIIIAQTKKGYGVTIAEDQDDFHGKPFTVSQVPAILQELAQRFSFGASYPENPDQYTWHPTIPETDRTEKMGPVRLPEPVHALGEKIATRKAYGLALAAAGLVCPDIVSLDAEVKNSTFAQTFETLFPERFYQCFIAEQNMVNMGIGFAARGAIPFISTFAAFFARAYDQLRMAAIGKVPLRLAGSHVGVSIGADGPSQMGLEDIAMMRALPDSIVLYPCDAISTYKLVEQMANYTDGISYLRTTRESTPVIYGHTTEFSIGGCKVLHHQPNTDQVCIVAAGITVHEALKAHELLKAQGIMTAVIDLYSVKPLDHETLIRVAQASGNRIITVEDHYLEGGLGQAVVYELCNTNITVECLAVRELPRSGEPQELLARYGIEAQAIVEKVIRAS